MKTRIGLLTASLLAILPFASYSQTPDDVSRRVLFSVGINEKPVFNKSSLLISPIGTETIVITEDDKENFYAYENGKKKGPFKSVQGTGVKLPQDDLKEFDPIFRKESDDYQKYISNDKDGQIKLNFQGRTYGPYQFILELYLSADQKSFNAIAMKDARPVIITSGGSVFPLEGQPGYNYISPTREKMMVTTIKENENPGNNGSTGSAQVPEAYIYFEDGKKFGPYNPKKITGYNPAFSKTGGDNWLLTMDSKLYINGKLVQSLPDEKISPANIWLTEDGKRYAVIVYNRIEFHDGKIFNDPLKIRISVANNKITVWWLSYENEKDIVLNSRII
jgi:hypothetical protein